MKKIGLIINPWAGMGGCVGLKGTDGVIHEAIRLGAAPTAQKRVAQTLEMLLALKEEIEIFTCSGMMGEDLVKNMGFHHQVCWQYTTQWSAAEDTIHAARKMLELKVEIILFAGGDGTARDMFSAVGDSVTCIGIPAGVKIHSPVFAQSPTKAGELVKRFLEGRVKQTIETEVLDLDEAAYRNNEVRTQLFGYLKIPLDRAYTQCRKMASPLSEAAEQEGIAAFVVNQMLPNVTYIIGPGTTTRQVMSQLSLEGTLLGIDIVKDRKLIAKDATEAEILSHVNAGSTKLVLTPTGGQGFILGRGNQQISKAVLKHLNREDVVVLSTKEKIAALKGRPLMIDTGCQETNDRLSGYVKVHVGYGAYMMYRISQ